MTQSSVVAAITAKAAGEEAAKKLADYGKAYEDAVNSADANADAAATELKAAQENAEALAKALKLPRAQWIPPQQVPSGYCR
ncbi:MAG: hypothetical protein ACLVGL_08945 [Waltera sp.]